MQEGEASKPIFSGEEKEKRDAAIRQAYPKVLLYCRILLRDQDKGEDLAHQAIQKALESWDQFRGEAELATWIRTIALNIFRMDLRKRRRISGKDDVSLSDIGDISDRSNAERQIIQQMDHERIKNFLMRCPVI